MRKLWLLCAIWACSASAQASDQGVLLLQGLDGRFVVCDETRDCNRLDGLRGVWWPLGRAQDLAKAHVLVPKLNVMVADLERQLEARGGSLSICTAQKSLLQVERDRLVDTSTDAAARDRRMQAALERSEARASRRLWVALGLSVTAGLAGVLLFVR